MNKLVTTRFVQFFITRYKELVKRMTDFFSRRPHRSFKRTYRRDYVRSLQLPGYWSFTNYVRKTLFVHKRLFLQLAAVYAVLVVVFIGMASQDIYSELGDSVREASEEIFQGKPDKLAEAGALLFTGITGGLNSTPTELQQGLGMIFALFIWLTTVWLLRSLLAGKKPKLRDALYNAGAPILPTFLVSLVVIVQLLPIVLAIVAYTAAVASKFLTGGIETMLFWVVASLLGVLSLYWITSTMIALIVVTLPGMYPLRAIKNAGDLVIGRRIRILLRLLWMVLVVIVGVVTIMVPIILLDAWLKGIWLQLDAVPIVPVALLIVSTLTVIFAAAYIYLLYRKVVDDDAAPA